MKTLRAIILFALPFICWGVLAINFLNQGNAWAATFASLPFIAFVFFVVSPHRGPGHFAFTREIGPVEQEEETEKQYHMKMAKWWFAGSLSFPVCIAIAFSFSKYEGFAVAAMFVGIILGIPCFLKLLGSLFHAIRAKS
jgi:hypothetical protein